MKELRNAICVGICSSIFIGITGCGIWPVMTEDNGRWPRAMGKSDQVFSPWATQPVHLVEDYGGSYRLAMESQILNPQSAKSLNVVEGIGGTESNYSMARYQLMFQNPPFSMSTSTGGGGKKKKSGGGKKK